VFRLLTSEETEKYTELRARDDFKRDSMALRVMQNLIDCVPGSCLPQNIRKDYFDLLEFELVCDFSSGLYDGAAYSQFLAPFSIWTLGGDKIEEFSANDILSYARDAKAPKGSVCVAVLHLSDFASRDMGIEFTFNDELDADEVFLFKVYVIDDMLDTDPAKTDALKRFDQYVHGVETDGEIVFAGVGDEKFKLVAGDSAQALTRAIFTDLIESRK